MKKLAVICAACLVVITLILVRREWTDYRRAREAEAALREFERNRPERVKVDVPRGGEVAPASPTPDKLMVIVDGGGATRLSVGGAGEELVADAEQLRARLEQLVRTRRESGLGGAVFVKTSPGVKYAEVVGIIDAARRAGADPVGLETSTSK